MTRLIALTRFRLTGYVRSFRVLHPFIALVLLLMIVFTSPLGGDPRQQVLASFADLAALMFPIWAWAARGVIDTEPDVQRGLAELAAGSRDRSTAAGLLAAYLVNVGFAMVALGWLVVSGVAYGLSPASMLLMGALYLLVALPATVVGAWTCRAVLPRTALSVLVLLGTCVALLLLSIGSLRWLSVPMITWMRAANTGPDGFTAAVPGLSVHILAWSAVAGAGYFGVRRFRP